MKDKYICCICGEVNEGYGNNPEGAMWKDINGNIIDPIFPEGARCCNECDNKFVIPGRIYRLKQLRKAGK